MVQWYHEQLCHPGETCTLETTNQHFYWKNVHNTVKRVCSKCNLCQRTKRSQRKCSHAPVKIAEVVPWQTLCIDLIGPHELTAKNGNKKETIKIWAITMIDPATGWLEIVPIEMKRANVASNLIKQNWLA